MLSAGYSPEANELHIHPSLVTGAGGLPPNIGSFIGERLHDADNDIQVPPWDSVR